MSNFSKFIEEQNQVITLLLEDIKEDLPLKTVINLKKSLLGAYLERSIAMFSANYSKEAISLSLLETIPAFVDNFKWEGIEGYGDYEEMLWLLSLAILCDIPDEPLEDIVKILERDNAKDRLLKTLVNYRFPNRLSSGSANYLQRLPYADLDSVIIGVDKKVSSIKNYLDKKWYQAMDEEAWHDSHKNTKVNTYFGYWAWETAALAKIHGIEDKSLENQKYYPFRAVHW